ncbi:MAG: Rhodanese- sulfurtransferase [Peltula sp. TS41687]|nr:MAG: Rhodanese- sulfurtransferase [Peltula sp. TS41687]
MASEPTPPLHPDTQETTKPSRPSVPTPLPTPQTTNQPTNPSLSPSPILVSKPTPYTFDLGHLLASDPNPLPLPLPSTTTIETTLQTTARDGAQALINQLLTTCTIRSTPAGVLLTLPAGNTALPREKAVPAPKAETKWQAFAKKKGITPKKRHGEKVVFDEGRGEWAPRWGFGGVNGKGKGKGEWLVEVGDDDGGKKDIGKEGKNGKGKAKGGEDGDGDGDAVRGLKRRERKEGVRRNERRMRANERRGKKGGGGG